MFAICAIAKNEPVSYVEEWLNWHRDKGVDKFFIYDDGGWEVTGNDIEIRPSDGTGRQLEVYNHCLRNCDNSDYLAFIDLDEFLMGSVIHRMPEVENALTLNWKMFGTSGMEWNPYGKQMGVFRCCIPASAGVNSHVKSIVRPSKTIRMNVSHCGLYVGGGQSEDFTGKKFTGPFNPIDRFPDAWINHYYTRSISDWRHKVARKKNDGWHTRLFETVFLIDFCCTEMEDGHSCNSGISFRALYGTSQNMKDVTDKVIKMARDARILIRGNEYNKLFGDPVYGQIKTFQVEFERQGECIGKFAVTENEPFDMS